MEIIKSKKSKVKKNFVKNLISIFEQSERIICVSRSEQENLRPFVVRLLNKRNKNLFLKYVTEKALPSTPSKLEINYHPVDEESHKQSGDSSLKTRTFEKPKQDKEISIACQTEDKSSSLSQKTFSGERKALETRIAAEKQNQIKWIESEIHHLNILRDLLEKQNKSSERKKNHLDLSNKSDDLSKNNGKNFSENGTMENHSHRARVIEESIFSQEVQKVSYKNSTSSSKIQSPPTKESEVLPVVSDPNYGMAVSLVGRVRKVMMFPIGVEFNVNDSELKWRCSTSSNADSDLDQRHSHLSKPQASNIMTRHEYPNQEYSEYSNIHVNTTHNVNTQFPSVERGGPVPRHSISVQTDLPALRKCQHCHQDICVCLSLSKSDKSDCTPSGLSKENPNGTARKEESPKMSFNNKNESSDNRKSSCSTSPEVVEIANLRNSPEATRQSNDKRPSSKCRCENCPKRNASPQRKSGVVYALTSSTSQKPCQSNIYVNCGKSNDVGPSRCSKVQVEKSSNCACHIIKIHDSKCCSSLGGTCCTKKKNSAKMMENQASQTEQTIVERKNLITNSELVKPPKAPEVMYRMENRTGIETKRSVDKKFLCNPKVSIEKRHASPTLEVKQKCAVSKEFSNGLFTENCIPCDEIYECRCYCQKNVEKEKVQEDDHPRHYFLKIEEKEVDDSNESFTRRPSVDVITVTVPVKRSNKTKSNGKNQMPSYRNNQYSVDSVESYQKNTGCNCCDQCNGQSRQQISQQFETQMNDRFRKTKAEKPSSPNVNGKPYEKIIESSSFEEVPDYGENTFKYFGVNRQSSSSQEYYHSKEIENAAEGNTYFSRSPSGYNNNYNGFQQPQKRNDYREVQMDYDSHKDYGNLYENSYSNGLIEIEELKPRGKIRNDKRYYYPSEPEKSNQYLDQDRFQSDYYNYDKKEFMTRSEIQKEEKKKKKVLQPTLQEYLESNRPDFYNNAESRRRAISQRTKERERKQKLRMECLMNLMHRCNDSEQLKHNSGPKRMFTTAQMKEQTKRLYKKLPEVTGKIADQKKRAEYRTNKLMADVFAKKLQLEALKGICDCQCEDY